MSIDKIHQLVGSLAKAVDENQRIPTPILAAKLARYVEVYPQDKTLGSMSRIIDKMVDNNTNFIRKAELKSLYGKLYQHGTKVAELLSDELGEQSEPEITTYHRDEAVSEINPYQFGDQVMANALASAFDKHLPLKLYSQPVADKAMKSVGSTLDAWNLRPSSLAVSDGNDKFIVIKADYDTPKGVTSFYVPVEVTKNDVVEPQVFMGNTGPEDLNHKSIKAYLTQQAGSKTKIGATDILTALTHAASDKREVTAAEMAVIRMNAARQNQSEFFEGQVVGLKVEAAAKPDVALPKSDDVCFF
ncbi:MAG: hypothetical protein HC877_23900 [Thioploca sp.]|nr:hypothetical protein [Thioploca sp.]